MQNELAQPARLAFRGLSELAQPAHTLPGKVKAEVGHLFTLPSPLGGQGKVTNGRRGNPVGLASPRSGLPRGLAWPRMATGAQSRKPRLGRPEDSGGNIGNKWRGKLRGKALCYCRHVVGMEKSEFSRLQGALL